MAEQLLRIGEVAAKAGVSTRTVDFYTTIGLLTPAGRTSGNFRLYDPATVERIGTIRQLEAHGVPLEEIAKATAGAAHHTGLQMLFDQLGDDLVALQSAAAGANAEAHGLIAAIAARAHNLIMTAIELAAGLPPPPV